MHWNLVNDKEFGSFKLLKSKYRREDQIIQPFCGIGSPQEIRSPFFNLRKFHKSQKSTPESCRMHWNLMNDKEFGFSKLLKLKYRRGGPNNSVVLQNWFPQEIRSPLFNLRKFRKAEKNTAESCRSYRNLMNNKEFGSFKLLKLKNRRGDQIIQSFCRIGSPEEIRVPLL